MPSRTRLAFVACVAFITGGCKPTMTDVYAALPAVGSPLPEFEFPRVSGGVIGRASDAGTPTIVALWSSQCSASRLALESLAELETAYRARGARVVIIADDERRDVVQPLLDRANFHGQVGLASGKLVRTFTHQASILPWRAAYALPTFFVLAADGRVVFRQVGIELASANRLQSVRAQTDSLLANP